MDAKHPKRKKDKQNPYTLSIENGKEYISFHDTLLEEQVSGCGMY